jgi:hypothetical protein
MARRYDWWRGGRKEVPRLTHEHYMDDVGETTLRLIAAVLPGSAPTARKVVARLIVGRGTFGSALTFSRALGFDNRHQLSRELAREGVPALEDLAGWVKTILWTAEWELHHRALSNAALRDAADPAIRYRTVERITGRPWSEVRRLGTVGLILQLDTIIRAARDRDRTHPRQPPGAA